MGACLLTIDPPRSKRHREAWLGYWDAKAEFSTETVNIFAVHLVPLLICSRPFPLNGFDTFLAEPIPYDEAHEAQRHVKLNRDVLGSLILSLGLPNNGERVFSTFDLEDGLHTSESA